MMDDLQTVHSAIKQLCYDRYYKAADFNEFADALQSYGVIRYTFDILGNEYYFYSNDNLLYRLALEQIEDAADGAPEFTISNTLDANKLTMVIHAFNAQKITVPEFYNELTGCGVVYVCMYLKHKKIYYFGQDSQFYLENYS